MSVDVTKCLFYEVFRDHGASVIVCTFEPCDGYRSLAADISYLNANCPCCFYTTLDDVRSALKVDGFHP